MSRDQRQTRTASDTTKPTTTHRRRVIAGLGAGAMVATAAALAGRQGETAPVDQSPTSGTMPAESARRVERCELPERIHRSLGFANDLVWTHDGRRLRFYDDLVRGKVVLLHLFALDHQAHHGNSLANLAAVARFLGPRLGRDTFMVSLTVEPERDTPERLAAIADEYAIGRGWSLISTTPESTAAIRGSLYFRPGGPGLDAPAHGDCSMGLLRYGNEPVGLWGSVPTRAEPAWIAGRLDWIRSREHASRQPLRRKGPPARPDQREHNKERQG